MANDEGRIRMLPLTLSCTLLLIGAARAALWAQPLVDLHAVVDGTVRDGLSEPYDGIPDDTHTIIVQVLHTNRPVNPFEDRGVVEFDISGLSLPIPSVYLYLRVHGANGPYPFAVDVYSYAGDGQLTLFDFLDGVLFTSFDYEGEAADLLDVTEPLADLIAVGADFAGFNIRFSVPDPTGSNGPFVTYRSLEFPPEARLLSAVAIFSDGFESSDTSAWNQTVP